MAGSPHILIYLIIVLIVSPTIDAQAISKDGFVSILHKLCHSFCMNHLKDEDMCLTFCRFVQHIEENHGDEILEIYNKELDSAAVMFAMEDVVRFRRQNNVEDDHLIADTFLSSFKKQIELNKLYNKDEL